MKTIADKPWKLVRYCLFLIAILLTVYFGIFDYFKPPFELSSTFRGPSDRNIHIIALATMTLVLMIGQKKQIAFFVFMLMFAAVLEAMQVFIPTRTASLSDLLASLAGVVIGAGIASIINQLIRRFWFVSTPEGENLGRRASDRRPQI